MGTLQKLLSDDNSDNGVSAYLSSRFGENSHLYCKVS